MSSYQDAVNIPRPRKSVTFGLIILALFSPFFALYLDGASWPTVGLNFAAWIFFPIVGTIGAIIHAIICLFRNNQHRQFSKPARRRLRYNNNYSARPKDKMEEETIEAAPAPVQRAVIEEPGPAERVPTERPAQREKTEESVPRPLTASSTTSVSSSDVEKKAAPAAVPPPRTASSTTSVSSSDVEKKDAPAAVPPPRTASSTTSVSSSDVEKKTAPAAVPPPRTASATPARTTTTFGEELHELVSKM